MTKTLIVLHVLAAILAVGPVTVAASMFPAAVRHAQPEPERREQLTVLHRICNVYAVVGVAVPIFGFGAATRLHVLGSPWLVASMALTAAAVLVLAAIILPAQRRILAALNAGGQSIGAQESAPRLGRGQPRRLAASTGTFNLLWVAVTVLMIVQPGSTAGA